MILRRMARELTPVNLRRAAGQIAGRNTRPRVRRYIPAGLGVEGFFAALQEASARCIVLRWFEDLPAVLPGEDLDMLVMDEDLAKLSGHLDNYSGAVPCDIYSVAGTPGTLYKNQPYYPRQLAEQMIARRELFKGLYPVPCAEDHFYGLAYHAVYHKGSASGLRFRLAEIVPVEQPDHDYYGALASLGQSLGLEVGITLDDLDSFLAGAGFRPSGEVLRALGKSNRWVEVKFFK